MKTKKIFTAMLMMAILFNFTACSNDDDEIVNTHDDAYGDVLTKKMMMMGQEKYLPIFFVGAEGVVADGSSVKGPDGTVYDLHAFWAGDGKLTAVGMAGNTIPPAGTYTFTLKFSDGYEKTVTDVLEGEDTSIPDINLVYNQNANPQTIEVTWNDVPQADFYCVKLVEKDPNTGKIADAKPLYKVPMIDKTNLSHTITLDGSNGWMRPVTDLQDGAEYFVVISAKKVEAGTPVTGASKDFEVNGCSKSTFTYQQ